METFFAWLAICARNPSVPGDFPAQRPVTRSFDVFFDLHLNERLSKQSWGWWFETLSLPLWRHRNDALFIIIISCHSMTNDRYDLAIWTLFLKEIKNNCRIILVSQLWKNILKTFQLCNIPDEFWYAYLGTSYGIHDWVGKFVKSG